MLKSNAINIILINGVELNLSLPSLTTSYIKDDWVTVFEPNDNARFYLHIKYLYLAEDADEDKAPLLDSFSNPNLRLENYLHVFPGMQRRSSSISTITPNSPQERADSPSALPIIIIFASIFLSFFIAWTLTSRISRGYRIIVVSCLSTFILL